MTYVEHYSGMTILECVTISSVFVKIHFNFIQMIEYNQNEDPFLMLNVPY